MYPVKYFRDGQVGAPVLTGTPGALIAVLDACLIDGFNAHLLDSLTQVGGVATATVAAGHGYVEGDILLLSGADQAEYNGEVKISNVTITAFDFAVPDAPASPATGVITSRIAPVGGWSKAFSGANKAAYRTSAVGGLLGMYYRVDDTGTTLARVVGYESMTDVDTGIGAFPSDAQVGGGGWWWKSDSADATARPWTLAGDAGLFYWFPDRRSSQQPPVYCAGEMETWKLGDQYAGLLIAGNANLNNWPGTALTYLDGASNMAWIARDHTQIGGAEPARFYGHRLGGTRLGVGGAQWPGVVDFGLYHAQITYTEDNSIPRGAVIGLYQPIQDMPLSPGDVAPGALGGDRDLLVVGHGYYTGGWLSGRALIDITGPWR